MICGKCQVSVFTSMYVIFYCAESNQLITCVLYMIWEQRGGQFYFSRSANWRLLYLDYASVLVGIIITFTTQYSWYPSKYIPSSVAKLILFPCCKWHDRTSYDYVCAQLHWNSYDAELTGSSNQETDTFPLGGFERIPYQQISPWCNPPPPPPPPRF